MGYFVYVAIFAMLMLSFISLGMHDFSGLKEAARAGFTGDAITGAVIEAPEESAIEKQPAPLLSVAILLVTLSFLTGVLVANSVKRKARYRA